MPSVGMSPYQTAVVAQAVVLGQAITVLAATADHYTIVAGDGSAVCNLDPQQAAFATDAQAKFQTLSVTPAPSWSPTAFLTGT